MKKLYHFISILSIIVATMTFVSCDNVNDWATDESYNRLFSPALFEAVNIEQTSVSLRFSRTANADTYIIELSKDSLVFDNIVKKISIPDSVAVLDTTQVNKIFMGTVDNLVPNTLYSARIKTQSDTGIPDSRWVTLTFRTEN